MSRDDEELPGGGSFAEMMSAFGKLGELESKIAIAIERSKVPWSETRKFLKGFGVCEISNTPVLQYLYNLFETIGLGRLELTNAALFSYTFEIKDCPVCHLFPDIADEKVCSPTADALARFFTEDLGLACEVVETRCRNTGDPVCEFKIDLHPLEAYKILLDETDIRILEATSKPHFDEGVLVEQLDIDEDELMSRLECQQYYQLIDENFEITEAGRTYYDYISTQERTPEREFEPPWRSISQITTSIAASRSFAEALVEVTEDEQLPWEVDDSEIIDLRKKALRSRGFAELLADEMNDEEEEE